MRYFEIGLYLWVARERTGPGAEAYIVSEIAKAHGGTIAVESDANRTRFMTLPAVAIGVYAPRFLDLCLAAVFRSCPASASSTECESVSFASFFAIVVSFP